MDNGGGMRELAVLKAAERRLAECTDLQDVMDIRDEAEIVRIYAKQQRMGLQIQNQAAKVKLHAERKMGAALASMKLRGGDRKSKLRDATLMLGLNDMGIDRKQSYHWQLESSISSEQFEEFCGDLERQGGEICSAALLRYVRSLRPKRSNGRRRPGHSGNGHHATQPSSNGFPLDVVDTLSEMRNHLSTVSRMFAEICQRPSCGLERIERHEIPRYLGDVLAMIDGMEGRLQAKHESTR
jgi:hypothetical protein